MEKSASYIGAEAQAGAAGSRSLHRLQCLMLAVCCGSVIGLAVWLTPETAGVGTHRQLGLPKCSFLAQTGYPCPTCGMTTSVSAMAHGQFALALASHPFGVVLFSGLVVLAAAAVVEVLTGQSVLSRLGRPGRWVWTFVIGIPAGWVLKLIWGIIDGTLPT